MVRIAFVVHTLEMTTVFACARSDSRRCPATLRDAAARFGAAEANMCTDTRAVRSVREIGRTISHVVGVSQTRHDTLADPPPDRDEISHPARTLSFYLDVPPRCLYSWNFPQGRPTIKRERRRGAHEEPARGVQRPVDDGQHDGRHEKADGDDGPADGHHGMDQLLLPGLCLECV